MQKVTLFILLIVFTFGCKENPSDPDPVNNAPITTVHTVSDLEIPAQQEITYNFSDADGLVTADLNGSFPNREGNYSLTKNFADGVTAWDTTLTRDIGLAGQGSFGALVTSKTPTGTETSADSQTTTYNLRETTDTQFSSIFTPARAGEQETYLLRFNEADSIANVIHKEVFPGTTDTVQTVLTANGTTFEQSLQKTFEQKGSYFSRLEVEDAFGNVQTDENCITVYAPMTNREVVENEISATLNQLYISTGLFFLISSLIAGYLFVAKKSNIRAERKKFKQSIQFAPIPVMIHRNGKILQLSEEWTRLTGYTIKEIPAVKEWSKKAYGEEFIPSTEFIRVL
jgi:hypothetical protein